MLWLLIERELVEIATFPQRCLETRGIVVICFQKRSLTFGCFNYLHGGKKYRNNREETRRNLAFGSDRTAYLLHIGYHTLRIREPENQNSDNETKKVFKKYKNISMSSSFKKKKRVA